MWHKSTNRDIQLGLNHWKDWKLEKSVQRRSDTWRKKKQSEDYLIGSVQLKASEHKEE